MKNSFPLDIQENLTLEKYCWSTNSYDLRLICFTELYVDRIQNLLVDCRTFNCPRAFLRIILCKSFRTRYEGSSLHTNPFGCY